MERKNQPMLAIAQRPSDASPSMPESIRTDIKFHGSDFSFDP
jgi:hypothetical protein